jgi:hypothetical protein
MNRHKGVEWTDVESRLQQYPDKLWSLYEMEKSGGEPDVVVIENKNDSFYFYDCSKETPIGRRNVCYDRESLESRKANKPMNNAMDMAESMGISLMNEKEYRDLQKLGQFDTKTSSWIKTPPEIRKLGGALFADRRYNQVFVYHNSAPSYYSTRGFRGVLEIG